MAYATGAEFLEGDVSLLCPFSVDGRVRCRNGNLTIFSRAPVTCGGGGGGAACACGSAVAWMARRREGERGRERERDTFPSSSSSALRYLHYVVAGKRGNRRCRRRCRRVRTRLDESASAMEAEEAEVLRAKVLLIIKRDLRALFSWTHRNPLQQDATMAAPPDRKSRASSKTCAHAHVFV